MRRLDIPVYSCPMRKRLTTVGQSRAVILPPELLERYGFADEVEIEAGADGLLIRPARMGLNFEAAAEHLFTEKAELLKRLSKA